MTTKKFYMVVISLSILFGSIAYSIVPATRVGGVQITGQATTPVASGKKGVWVDTTTLANLRYDDATNSNYVCAAPVTTKGDLVPFNGANFVRLAPGTNGQCLTAQSGQSSGLQWASCGGGSTGNWSFSGNNADLTGAGALGVGVGGTATSVAFGPGTLTCKANTTVGMATQAATNTTALSFAPNVADGATSVAFDINPSTTLSNATASFMSIRNNGTQIMNINKFDIDGVKLVDGGASAFSFLKLSTNNGTTLGYHNSSVQMGSNVYITDNVGSVNLSSGNVIYTLADNAAPNTDGGAKLGLVGTRWSQIAAKQVIQGTQNLSFSATPAFDCTAGGVIHIGTITGNVTGPTMVGGAAGQSCTILFLKDATSGVFTINGWGANTRTAGTMTYLTAASTIFTITFVWDDRLGTAQWVETARTGPI